MKLENFNKVIECDIQEYKKRCMIKKEEIVLINGQYTRLMEEVKSNYI